MKNAILRQCLRLCGVALTLAVLAGCSSRSTSTGTPPGDGGTCVPGTTLACLGPGRCDGVQVCATDGNSYEECECGGGSGGSGGSAGAAAGGSGGSAAGSGGNIGQSGNGGNATAGTGGSSQSCPDGQACATGADTGICLGGACCTGCVSGGVCVQGASLAECGRGGAGCSDCRLGSADGNCTDDPSCLNSAPMHYYVPRECRADGTCGYSANVTCCPNGCNASGCI